MSQSERLIQTASISKGGKTTIPKPIRNMLGVDVGKDEIKFVLCEDGEIKIRANDE